MCAPPVVAISDVGAAAGRSDRRAHGSNEAHAVGLTKSG